MDFFKLSKIKRPSSTPVTIEAKLSSSRIMSAACFDTSEPAIPIATPISAFFNAGESLTPSPKDNNILQNSSEPCVEIRQSLNFSAKLLKFCKPEHNIKNIFSCCIDVNLDLRRTEMAPRSFSKWRRQVYVKLQECLFCGHV